jgi:hypothetical protein
MNEPIPSNLKLPDHEKRMKAAEERARWKLGDRGWGGLLVGAYLAPDEAMATLREEEAQYD